MSPIYIPSTTTSPSFPPFPVFAPSLRLATLADLPRIGYIATTGFLPTQIFQFTRPFHAQFPHDTFLSMTSLFRLAIIDPDTVVLVVEDEYDDAEEAHYASSISPLMEPGAGAGKRVVVGVAAWRFEKGSARRGQFLPQTERSEELAKAGSSMLGSEAGVFAGQDEITSRVERVNSAIEAANEKYFPHSSLLEKLVFHPSYQRRGHGPTLLTWGKQLADMDGVDQGILASRMGEKIALAQGFERLGSVHVEGDVMEKEGIDIIVGVYRARARP